MHRPADAMADVLPNDAVVVLDRHRLDGRADVSGAPTRLDCPDALPQGPFGFHQQGLDGGIDLPDGEGQGCVGVPPLVDGAHIQREDVAFSQRVTAWDAVHDHLVRGCADVAWKTVIAQERRRAAVVLHDRGGEGIEFGRGDAGPGGLSQLLVHGGNASTGDGHLLELVRLLDGDHASSSKTRAVISSIEPVPSTRFTMPRGS